MLRVLEPQAPYLASQGPWSTQEDQLDKAPKLKFETYNFLANH